MARELRPGDQRPDRIDADPFRWRRVPLVVDLDRLDDAQVGMLTRFGVATACTGSARRAVRFRRFAQESTREHTRQYALADPRDAGQQDGVRPTLLLPEPATQRRALPWQRLGRNAQPPVFAEDVVAGHKASTIFRKSVWIASRGRVASITLKRRGSAFARSR